jgi:glycosyltransferase involved in cell wall biosynthesis
MRMSDFGIAPYVARRDFEANLSNKSIEYLSSGLPILTSLSRGILYDLLVEHDCGASYSGHAHELAAVISGLMADPGQRRQMGENAARLFHARFEAHKVYGEMTRHLEAVVAAHRSRLGEKEKQVSDGPSRPGRTGIRWPDRMVN